jgi:hypothetical protein
VLRIEEQVARIERAIRALIDHPGNPFTGAFIAERKLERE